MYNSIIDLTIRSKYNSKTYYTPYTITIKLLDYLYLRCIL